ncbi:peptide chain release factor N(5)-glutamine methyltransferase [Nitrogeniibacter mangrovi]|uniref:Release factor glutamine methyltransferase n=1 Tax=Nitrogeniibacter mangrovi TaxID=2016596 RepID=A0A6C1B2K9_9RHOO|nr:peptide chain release factor N(5)-glutamine methyltransferase [Nitrogeniibacter mangrovi]QID17125.1 peptide chain release factor N(5)-glutamine methyltransferase [Nitrogeniibacter mangrovi]
MAAEPPSLGEALAHASARIGRVDARILLAHVLDKPVSYLVAFPERALSDAQQASLRELVRRRESGEPVAYLVGEREFYGRRFHVGPQVLIPRPETELLVDLAREAFPSGAGRVLDLGTGSGALAVTLACEWPAAEVVAVDASEAALSMAAKNAARLGASVRWVRSDWFEALAGEAPFDLIVSNPPYVGDADPHLSQGDVRFEPRTALAAGADGLDDIRRIVAAAPAFLRTGGCLLVEHGYDQAAAARELMEVGPFIGVHSWCDLAGIQRVTGARLDGGAEPA